MKKRNSLNENFNILNKSKFDTKKKLNIKCIKNLKGKRLKKFSKKTLLTNNNTLSKENNIEKDNKKTITKKRNISFLPNFISNNYTLSNNSNINVNMINHNFNNSNKFLTRQTSKNDIKKKKIKKTVPELSNKFINTNFPEYIRDKRIDNLNIKSYFESNKNSKSFKKKINFNSKKNFTSIPTKNNSPKKSEKKKNPRKIILDNFKRNKHLYSISNNYYAITNNNLFKLYKPKQFQKRKLNNSQNNSLINNMKKPFNMTLLYKGQNDNKSEILKYNNTFDINLNKKQNSSIRLTDSMISPKYLLNKNFIKSCKILNSNSLNNWIAEIFNKEIKEMKINLEKSLDKNNNNDKNVDELKIIKNSFNDFLKLLNQTLGKQTFNTLNDFLQKINSYYENTIASLTSDNNKLKRINESLAKEKSKIGKKYYEMKKISQENKIKYKKLEKKYLLLLNLINQNIDIPDKSHNYYNEKDIGGKIYQLNKNNLEDLDALYFFDKIKIGPQKSYNIRLSLSSMNKKIKNSIEKELDYMNKKDLGIINVSDVKFISDYFNNFRKEFELEE